MAAPPHNPFLHDEAVHQQHQQQQGQQPMSSNPFSSPGMTSATTTAPATTTMMMPSQHPQQQQQNPFSAGVPQSYITPQQQQQQQQLYAPPPGPPPPLAGEMPQQQYYAGAGASSQFQSSSSGEVPSSPSTNPFRYAGASAPAGVGASAIPAPSMQQQDAAPHPQVSHISDELQGLDFGNGASSSSGGAQNGYETAAMYMTAAPPVDSSSLVAGAGLNQQGQGLPQATANNPVLEQNAAQNAQTTSDEAYARRLLEQQKLEQQLGTGRAPVRSASYGATGGQAVNGSAEEEAQWSLKDVYWRGMERKIITQNENGPCSLIALCNVLLLRGDLTITPADRPAVSYSYLSSLLADYLLSRPQDDSSNNSVDLSAALSILPRTQYGLDVNVRFDSIDSFAAGSSAAGGELALFKLCGVKLVHGWLPDPSDPETYNAVIRCGDYDKALDKVVEGDELAKGLLVESKNGPMTINNNGGGAAAEENVALGSHLDRVSKGKHVASHWSDEQAASVREALLIRDFLSSTSTQLSYHGLFVLAQSLQPGEIVTLFRNSHLSVLYRRLPNEGAAEEQPPTGGATGDLLGSSNAPAADASPHYPGDEVPQLFTLATDSAFLMEDEVVWESLADMDQAASEFYDGKFRKTRLEGDWVGVDARGRRRPLGTPGRGGAGYDGAIVDESGRVIPPGEDADFALAAQLQEEEQRRAAMRQQRRSGRGTSGGGGGGGYGAAASPFANFADEEGRPNETRHKKKSSGLGGLFKKNKNKEAPSASYQRGGFPAVQQANEPSTQNLMDEPVTTGTEGSGAAVTAGGKEKEKCSIM